MKKFLKESWYYIVPIVILPYLFKIPAVFSFMDFSKSNNAADAINGFTAPVIGIISIILLYKAYETQVKANESLKEANEYLKSENEFKFYSTEFTRLEIKVFSFYDKIVDLGKKDHNSVSKYEVVKFMSELVYLITIYNYIITLIDLERVSEIKDNSIFIDQNDRILLSNIYFLNVNVLQNLLTQFDVIKNAGIKKNFISDSDIIVKSYDSKVRELNETGEVIRNILFDINLQLKS